jgi:hypothetical protein
MTLAMMLRDDLAWVVANVSWCLICHSCEKGGEHRQKKDCRRLEVFDGGSAKWQSEEPTGNVDLLARRRVGDHATRERLGSEIEVG